MIESYRKEFVEHLDEKYMLVKKNKFYYAISGAMTVLIAMFSISYASVRTTISELASSATLAQLNDNIVATETYLEDY